MKRVGWRVVERVDRNEARSRVECLCLCLYVWDGRSRAKQGQECRLPSATSFSSNEDNVGGSWFRIDRISRYNGSSLGVANVSGFEDQD